MEINIGDILRDYSSYTIISEGLFTDYHILKAHVIFC